MSFDLIHKLRELKDCPIITGVTYSVLVTIASFVHQPKNSKKLNTTCYPTVELIAKHSHFCTKTVKRNIQKLKGLGLLHVERCAQSNRYVYNIKIKAVENLKETLILESPRMSPRKDLESPRISEANNKINNNKYINKYFITNPRVDLKESPTQPTPERMLLNDENSTTEFGCSGDIDQNIADGKYLYNSMEENEMWTVMRARAIPIRNKLIALRKELGLNFNDDEVLELDTIASRIKALIDSKMLMEKAINVCHAVVDLKYWMIKTAKTEEERIKQQQFFNVMSMFRKDKQFNFLRASLKNDCFVEPGKVIKFDEEKRKREWEKAKETDIEYKRLVVNRDVDELAWVNEKDFSKKTELMSKWHKSCALVEQYEMNFMAKRGNE